MRLDLEQDWGRAKAYIEKTLDKVFYVSLATVGPDGAPTVTPIGSLVLNDDRTGFFMERFPRSIPANARHNQNFCVLAENLKLRTAIS
ncbi:MAG: pyridoxamine 5'-phosphate oxidase family protein, partial [Propionibacteriaceae bacterium]|nr:pyridoxamine 5'-phosphate oxidase family protein [Propionibacteriaceae bacterium]